MYLLTQILKISKHSRNVGTRIVSLTTSWAHCSSQNKTSPSFKYKFVLASLFTQLSSFTHTHTHTHSHSHQDGPKWCRLHHVKTGELLLCLRRVSGHTETPDPQWTLTPSTQNNDKWLDLDEASRPLVGEGEGVRE